VAGGSKSVDEGTSVAAELDDSWFLHAAAAMTDQMLACPNAEVIGSLTSHQPVYVYEFDDRHAAEPDGVNPPFPMGAGHTLELPYLFKATGWRSPTPRPSSTCPPK
jgi:carboxylesterase type B